MRGGIGEALTPPDRHSSLTRTFSPDFLVNMSASADVLAQAKVEVALGAIPEGKNVRTLPPFCV
jgi:hypothetical protein